MEAKVSVIIPTLNAEACIEKLIQSLQEQTRRPDEIIVIDSKSDDKTVDFCKRAAGVVCMEIEREDFDHGETRNKALQASSGDFVLFLTQDALPADHHYIENILRPFSDNLIAMATGRQVAGRGAPLMERLTREFNYPEGGFVRVKEDIPRLGLKTFFSSNCCSAYRRAAYFEVGGFPAPALISEDLIIAAKFIYAGYKVAYCGDAMVCHWHKFTLKQQYSRNFDISASIAMHDEYFKGVAIRPEGIKMAKFVLKGLLKKGRVFQAVHYCFECLAKLLGHKHGGNYQKLGKNKILSKTMNKPFWEKIAV